MLSSLSNKTLQIDFLVLFGLVASIIRAKVVERNEDTIANYTNKTVVDPSNMIGHYFLATYLSSCTVYNVQTHFCGSYYN